MLNDNSIVVVRLCVSHYIDKICSSCSYIILNDEVEFRYRLCSENAFSDSDIVLTQN